MVRERRGSEGREGLGAPKARVGKNGSKTPRSGDFPSGKSQCTIVFSVFFACGTLNLTCGTLHLPNLRPMGRSFVNQKNAAQKMILQYKMYIYEMNIWTIFDGKHTWSAASTEIQNPGHMRRNWYRWYNQFQTPVRAGTVLGLFSWRKIEVV